jgi:hypothetical protein
MAHHVGHAADFRGRPEFVHSCLLRFGGFLESLHVDLDTDLVAEFEAVVSTARYQNLLKSNFVGDLFVGLC